MVAKPFFAYSANYLVDLDNAIVVDVEATTAIRQAEVTAAKRMLGRTREHFDLYPALLAGDSAYGSAEMLGWLVYEHGIEPHVTVFDKSARRDGTFSREDFTYDHESDAYLCPGAKVLTAARGRWSTTAPRCSIGRASTTAMCARSSRAAIRRRRPARCHGQSTRERGIWPATLPRVRKGDLAAPTQEDRDALRPPQAHPAPRSTSITRAERRA